MTRARAHATATTAAAAAVFALLCICTNAHAQGRTGTATPDQEALAAGEAAFAEDRFDVAAEKFAQAINLNPRLVTAYVKLGTIYYRQKQYTKAVALLRQSPDQTDLELREELGLNLYKTATPPPAEAIAVLDDVVAKKPEAYAAQGQLGQYYLKIDPRKAAAAIEAYLKYRPSNMTEADQAMHEKLGFAYLYAKEWEPAQREFESQLRAKPTDLNAKLGLGAAYVGKEDCSKAITLYERILGEAQKQPSIFYNLGFCYLKNNRALDAQREAELYTRAKPQDLKGHLLLGDAFLEQRNPQKALTAFLAAERLDQANPSVKTRLGKTYLAQKNYQAALAVLEVASKAAPGDVEVLCELAEVYAATNQPRDKLNALAGRLAAMSKDAKAQYAAGVAYWAANNDDGAAQAYRAAIGLEPQNGAARRALAKVLNRRAQQALDKNDTARALASLDESARLVPDDLMTARNHALVLLAAKKYGDAEQALAAPLKKVPDDMVLNRLLGRALVGQQKNAAAVKAYENAVKVALRVRGVDLAGVYTELGPLYLEDATRLDQAVSVLEQAVKEAGGSPLAQVAQRNLAIAYYKRGTARLRETKDAEGALDDIAHANQAPKGTFTQKEAAQLACAEAFAALKANKISQAEEAFGRAGGGCQVRAPYDKLGVQLFAAYAGYRDSSNPGRREAACRAFQSMSTKATGAAGEWVKQLQRSCWELLAYDWFQRSDEKRAEAALKTARRFAGKGDTRELEHNQGVLDMLLGRAAQAEKTFEALGARPAEALVNLGILRDRAGDARRALELYKRALEKGAHAPKLKEWIDVKERLFEVKS
jgi:tetratricopeptide (TPR) repeat protein